MTNVIDWGDACAEAGAGKSRSIAEKARMAFSLNYSLSPLPSFLPLTHVYLSTMPDSLASHARTRFSRPNDYRRQERGVRWVLDGRKERGRAG